MTAYRKLKATPFKPPATPARIVAKRPDLVMLPVDVAASAGHARRQVPRGTRQRKCKTVGASVMISVSRRTKAEVCRRLGWVALVAISTNEKVPRSFGDNEGVRPVILVVSRDPHRLAAEINGQQMVHDATAWHEWWAKDEQVVEDLKAHVETMLWQQGVTRVRDNKKAWNVDLALLELCVRQAAEADEITLAGPGTVDADVTRAITTGLDAIKAKRRL